MKSPVFLKRSLETQITLLISLFIAILLLSGITAFPIEWELRVANYWIEKFSWSNDLTKWILLTYRGVHETNLKYPFISYGTDWLAFAHLVIAVAFIGPLRDPVRNIWVIEFGLISCLAIFPLAFVCGPLRGIPFYWQMIDCSFGFFGGILLWICRGKIIQLSGARDTSKR